MQDIMLDTGRHIINLQEVALIKEARKVVIADTEVENFYEVTLKSGEGVNIRESDTTREKFIETCKSAHKILKYDKDLLVYHD